MFENVFHSSQCVCIFQSIFDNVMDETFKHVQYLIFKASFKGQKTI